MRVEDFESGVQVLGCNVQGGGGGGVKSVVNGLGHQHTRVGFRVSTNMWRPWLLCRNMVHALA